MAAGLSADQPPSGAAKAIRIEPLSPAVGLWVDGVDLHRLDGGSAAMIQDLWQLGGALLFRAQENPETAAVNLATVLAHGPVALTEGARAGDEIAGTHWQMPGGWLAVPHKALVFGPASGSAGLPELLMAGMEAAADTMRMEAPELLAGFIGLRCAHAPGGTGHPLVLRHPQSGEACLYPPPENGPPFLGAERLMTHASQARFCWRYDWQPGDVLAVDPRAVRCRWGEAPAAETACVVVPGTVPLSPEPASFGGWV